MSGAGLARAAELAAECLGVRAGERVAIVWGERQAAVAEALAAATHRRGGDVERLRFDDERDGIEPPAAIAVALLRADAAFGVTQGSMSHTRARIAATAQGMRFASLPGIDDEMFARTLDIDYARLKRDGAAIARLLSAAGSARITSPQGTDVTLSLAGRDGRNDDGDLRARSAFGNLPAGEAYIAPREDAGNGTIVYDGSLLGAGLLQEPVTVVLRDGRVESASGAAGAALLRTLDGGGEGGRRIAELGIGTNPAARIGGEILEDEKVRGTIHIAFGASDGIGGANAASVHVDGVIRSPTVTIGDVIVVEEGRLVEL